MKIQVLKTLKVGNGANKKVFLPGIVFDDSFAPIPKAILQEIEENTGTCELIQPPPPPPVKNTSDEPPANSAEETGEASTEEGTSSEDATPKRVKKTK